jgi:hypothetical protein
MAEPSLPDCLVNPALAGERSNDINLAGADTVNASPPVAVATFSSGRQKMALQKLEAEQERILAMSPVSKAMAIKRKRTYAARATKATEPRKRKHDLEFSAAGTWQRCVQPEEASPPPQKRTADMHTPAVPAADDDDMSGFSGGAQTQPSTPIVVSTDAATQRSRAPLTEVRAGSGSAELRTPPRGHMTAAEEIAGLATTQKIKQPTPEYLHDRCILA